jgi:beta-lactamase regulating signal transducer with metallopeptidase domain
MLLQIGLSNAVAATVLALLAATVGAFVRRPALIHALWLLVLIKLITPPLVSLPLPRLESTESTATVAVSEAAELSSNVPGSAAVSLKEVTPLEFVEEPNSLPMDWTMVDVAAEPIPTARASRQETNDAAGIALNLDRIELILSCLLLLGTASWLILTFARIGSFQRLMRDAQPAEPELQFQVEQMCKRLELSHCPAVWLVPGSVSPMLWGLFWPALLLPTDLLRRLDGQQQATLLLHELAHLRRHDHWVRLLELVVTGLYWWHPVVWWARREMRDAEEQCCDAWVVWALPGAAKSYATALVETVDFLTEARFALPPAASGVGQVKVLKRRLTMIMRGTTPRSLSVAGLLGVLGLGAMLLPLVPTWAQADPPEPPRPDPERREIRTEVQLRDADPRRAEEIEKNRQEAKKLAEEMQKITDQLHAMEKRFNDVQRRLAELGAPEAKDRVLHLRVQTLPPQLPMEVFRVRGVLHDDLAVLGAQLKAKEAAVQEAEARLQHAQKKLARMTNLFENKAVTKEILDEAIADVKINEAQLKARQADLEEAKLRHEAAKRQPVIAGARAVTVPVPAPPGAPLPENDRRLGELEKKLAELLREVQGLRQEMGRPQAPPGTAPPGLERRPQAPRPDGDRRPPASRDERQNDPVPVPVRPAPAASPERRP